MNVIIDIDQYFFNSKHKRLNRKTVRKLLEILPCFLVLVCLSIIISIQKHQTEQVFVQDKSKRLKRTENGSTNTAESSRNQASQILDTIDRYPFNGIAGLTDPKSPTQTALYWQIPRSGGTTLKYIMGTCLNLVQASRTSVDYCDVEVNDLHICHTRFGAYVNADPSDNHGIQRANDLGLVPSGFANVIVSSRFLHAASLFDRDHTARAFTVIRDPMERTVSTFYYLQEAHWERNYNVKYKSMTLMEYLKGDDVASNWMVRWLTGKHSDAVLTEKDLDFAEEILKRKFLILLTDEMKVSIDRLIKYMGWNVKEEDKACIEENVSKISKHNEHLHPNIQVGTDEYNVMKEMNHLDIKLYDYALGLFSVQWSELNL
mmetsp:Transcript_18033/g.20858  ORF Transcript_18033/g.20858 Transcript_18033/m.20858 type:complete len:374 (-) Transcript_18033:590-1711(-)